MGQPVFRVLGGFRDRVPAYASSAHLPSIDAYLEDVRGALAAGFRAYKIHPFGQPDRDVEVGFGEVFTFGLVGDTRIGGIGCSVDQLLVSRHAVAL